ncbi:hypothetical protein ACC754_40300, partial [Rhizobium johnstonii]
FGKWQSLSQLAGIFGNHIDRYVLASLAPAAYGPKHQMETKEKTTVITEYASEVYAAGAFLTIPMA